jgi:hypothetical protein
MKRYKVTMSWGGGWTDKTTGVKEVEVVVEAENQASSFVVASEVIRCLDLPDAEKFQSDLQKD